MNVSLGKWRTLSGPGHRMSYRPQLCTHRALRCFHCTGSEGKALSESWVCSESCQHKCWKPAWDALLCPSRPQGSGALPSPHACTVTQQLRWWYTCWCWPAVQAHHEEFGWLSCKAFDNRLWFYISAATVSHACCCCKFGPSDVGCTDLHKTMVRTWVSAHSLCKKVHLYY